MDLTTINSALSSLKIATDLASYLRNTDLNLKEAEQKNKIAELINALADAKIEFANFKEESIAREEKFEDYKKQQKLKEDILWERPYYWLKRKGEEDDGPFCATCYDNQSKRIRLQKSGTGRWKCETCNNYFTDNNHVPKNHRSNLSRKRSPSDWMS